MVLFLELNRAKHTETWIKSSYAVTKVEALASISSGFMKLKSLPVSLSQPPAQR